MGECISLHIEFTDPTHSKNIYASLSIAANPSDRTSQQGLRISLFLLIGFDTVAVIDIQAIPCSYPDLSPLIIIKCIYGKLRKPVVGSQIIEGHILCVSRRENGEAEKNNQPDYYHLVPHIMYSYRLVLVIKHYIIPVLYAKLVFFLYNSPNKLDILGRNCRFVRKMPLVCTVSRGCRTISGEICVSF